MTNDSRRAWKRLPVGVLLTLADEAGSHKRLVITGMARTSGCDTTAWSECPSSWSEAEEPASGRAIYQSRSSEDDADVIPVSAAELQGLSLRQEDLARIGEAVVTRLVSLLRKQGS